MYGPWTLGKCIYDARGNKIYEATSSTLGSKEKWLVKVMPNDDTQELSTLLALKAESTPLNMVQIPDSAYHQFGMNPTSVWFAMKHYEGPITKTHQKQWKRVATSCIDFICDLHKNHHRIYMDWRPENVLVDDKGSFVVADYETITTISRTKTRNVPFDSRWYYMYRGAEPDQWLYSWKMDLTGIAYMLIRLTTDGGSDICREFLECRAREKKTHSSMRYLAKKRNEIMYGFANPALKRFLDIIKPLKWNSQSPPLYSIYDSLKALFI